MHGNPDADAHRHKRIEIQFQVARQLADGKRAPNNPHIQQHQRGHSHQPQLFANHRQNEIGVRFGQEAAFNHRVAQAFAEQAAALQRQQRTQALIARARGVVPRLPHHFHAAQAVFVTPNGDNAHQHGNADGGEKPAFGHVRQKKQGQENGENHHGRPQIAREINQHGAERDGNADHDDALEVVQDVDFAAEKVRHVDNGYQFEDFAGLHFETERRGQPAACAVHLLAHEQNGK